MEALSGMMIGSYRLTHYLGSGGYGEVFLAEKPAVASGSPLVVVKAFHVGTHEMRENANSILRTAKTIAKIAHQNIVSVSDSGIDGNAAFLVMPYLPFGSIVPLLSSLNGGDSAINVQQSGGIPPALVAPIVTEVSQGLQEAHKLGVPHGDLKPSNIFLHAIPGRQPHVMVSDFGQISLLRAAQSGTFRAPQNGHTSANSLMQHLAAPEQFDGVTTPLSDQYALAAITCLLLTCLYPTQGGQQQVEKQGRSALSAVCAGLLPPRSVSVLRKALAIDPAQRFGDISAFATALNESLSDSKGLITSQPDHLAKPRILNSAKSVDSLNLLEATESFAPTQFHQINTLLEHIDKLTNGKAGLMQRAFTYLCIGGFAAVVNLVSLYLIYNTLSLPLSSNIHWLIGFVVAAELSTMTNFIFNDWLTFSHLPGHSRSWGMRCLRFHSTSLLGTIITLILSFALKTWLGIDAVIAEAMAIIIALAVNFTMHHIWTYRKVSKG